MSFWSQTSDSNRRFRTNPRNSSVVGRESSPDADMFFESPGGAGFSNFPRSHLAERLGNSVFDDFPSRRTGRGFHIPEQQFGSLHHHPPGDWGRNWVDATFGSRESSPTVEAREGATGGPGLARHQFFQRADSIPVRVSHESHQGSRSSTPESTGSTPSHASSGHSRQQSSSAEMPVNENVVNNGQAIPDGVEEHPGVSAKTARSSFTAKRQPKVHHIPILVESRDGAQSVVVTPPALDSPPTKNPNLFQMGGGTQPQQAAKQIPPSTSEPQMKKPVYPMPDVAASSSNATEKNNQSQNEEAVPIMADPSKPIPAAAPHSTSTPPPNTTAPANGNNSANDSQEPVKNKTLEQINSVNEEVEKWKDNVMQFSGVKGDKQYMYLDEMLTRCLIALDNVHTEGNDELRAARRAVVVAVNNTIRLLEQRAQKNKVAENSLATSATQADVKAVAETQANKQVDATSDSAEKTLETVQKSEQSQDEPKQMIQVQEKNANSEEKNEIVEISV